MKSEIIKAALAEVLLIIGFIFLYFSDYYQILSESEKTTYIIIFIAAITFLYGRIIYIVLRNRGKK